MNLTKWRQYDVDAAGAALLIGVALVGYALLIHAPLMDSMRHGRAQSQHEDVTATIALLNQKLDTTRLEIEEARRQLSVSKARTPSAQDMDDLLARIDAVASQCGVVLTQLQPMGVQHHSGYQVATFLVQGKASFKGLHQWFSLIESGVPYLDITHFSITVLDDKQRESGTGDDVMCRFECTKRLYLSGSEPGETALAKRP
ncbi:MAG: type 4a pilus biogenesis protein PilO [Phycisphaerae bacterium]|nr:type 4a pilus biogenesis protein PilO [Phycisphaerae bacterium]